MVKIFHEAPKEIFHEVQDRTDGDYCLVHLCDEDPEYKKLFTEAVEQGREVILDNSIFELEKAFDTEKFYFKVKEMKPTWYIVPDVLENAQETISNMEHWNAKHARHLPDSKKIGVVQGKTYSEIISCYEYMVTLGEVDMVAISFDYSYYVDSIKHPNKYISWTLGRVKLLSQMVKDGVIDPSIPHHLLGVALPQEGIFYQTSGWDWIYSMDTSNPVVHGIKYSPYDPWGLLSKESQKLYTLINEELNPTQKKLIFRNIQSFREFWNGEEKTHI